MLPDKTVRSLLSMQTCNHDLENLPRHARTARNMCVCACVRACLCVQVAAPTDPAGLYCVFCSHFTQRMACCLFPVTHKNACPAHILNKCLLPVATVLNPRAGICCMGSHVFPQESELTGSEKKRVEHTECGIQHLVDDTLPASSTHRNHTMHTAPGIR